MVTAYESAVFTESLFDPIVVEDSESDGCLPDSASTNESDRCEVFGQANDLLDQLAASEAGSRCRGR